MITINELQVENLKRIKAVKLEPSASGLTVIGGKNGQGKTSVLDAIAWALGGEKFRPTNPKRDGALTPPNLHVALSNGMIVEREGINGSLKVIDPTGKKSGQRLLDEFISKLALNLPAFLHASEAEKSKALLQIIGVGDKLTVLDRKEEQLYNQRQEVGRIADRKKKAAEEMPFYPNMPTEPVSVSDLLKEHQDILARNGENERKRINAREMQERFMRAESNYKAAMEALKAAEDTLRKARADAEVAAKSAQDLQDESTTELEENLRNVEVMNEKIRANAAKEGAELEANNLQQEYEGLTEQIESVRSDRADLLKEADLPLPGLSVKDGHLLYKGEPWDGMSGAEQLKVAVAIIRRLNPECGFVLMDKLEQMDTYTLKEFGKWLEEEGLQVIATRVSTGDECSIIIEDGMVKDDESAVKPQASKFVKGVF